MQTQASPPDYLRPYLSASEKYGSGFGTLLWASPRTQAVRFKALLSAVDVQSKTIIDVGCGRADLLEFMLTRGRFPRSYIGVEAVNILAIAAEKKQLPNCRIVRADFVDEPAVLNADADILMYSGSLNTMPADCFYTCLETAFHAAREAVVFNFLASPLLAASSHLAWHRPEDVVCFARSLSRRVEFFDRYLPGDATISIVKDSH